MSDRRDDGTPVQLHLQLAYKFDPIHDPRVRDLLARGYRIAQFQRVTDREAVVTLVPEAPGPEAGAAG
jgi:hypothetical protein